MSSALRLYVSNSEARDCVEFNIKVVEGDLLKALGWKNSTLMLRLPNPQDDGSQLPVTELHCIVHVHDSLCKLVLYTATGCWKCRWL